MNTLVIGGQAIAPGESRILELSLPPLYTHAAVSMPVHVINGRRPGPRLFVSAAIHGDEINGVEVIRRLLTNKALARLKGSLIAVPVVNVYGFVSRSRYLPDRRDLNRSFPGSETGSMASRLAELFMTEVVMQCSHGIDLHTGALGRENLPQVRAAIEGDRHTKELAESFGAPVILNADLRDGSLRAAVASHGIPVLLYEAGEALRFDEIAIRVGVKGVIRVMRALGMLPKKGMSASRRPPIVTNHSVWVRAPQSGILRSLVALGSQVQPGDELGVVADVFGNTDRSVTAPDAGVVIGRSNLPLVHEGEALFHIADYTKPEFAAQALEAFQEEFDPLLDTSPALEPPLV